MKGQNSLTTSILEVGFFGKIKTFSEWLKLHTTYSRLDNYNYLALTSTECGIDETPRKKDITVSLTTYAHRIHNVHLVIESLLRQTIKPNKIILWLSREEFIEESIPEILKRQRNRGLQIMYCDDIRSYKKIIPTLSHVPNDIIITVDDDIVYPHDHVERLYRAYLKEPQIVHCYRAHLMRMEKDRSIKPYREWDCESSHRESSIFIFPTGCAGVIYTRDHFDAEVNNIEALSELSPHADDIWLKLMTARRRTKCKVVPDARPLTHYLKIPDISGQSLISINKNANDGQLRKILARYPDIIENFLEKI